MGNNPVLHWCLFAAWFFMLAASAVIWAGALGSAMSDTPSEGPPYVVLWGAPVLFIVVFVGWLLT